MADTTAMDTTTTEDTATEAAIITITGTVTTMEGGTEHSLDAMATIDTQMTINVTLKENIMEIIQGTEATTATAEATAGTTEQHMATRITTHAAGGFPIHPDRLITDVIRRS